MLIFILANRNIKIGISDHLNQAPLPSSTSGGITLQVSDPIARYDKPRLYCFNLQKERIISKQLSSDLQQKGIAEIKQQLSDQLIRHGPICLLRLDACFILLVSQDNRRSPYSIIEQKIIKRGTIYLLKLAQYLQQYERAPEICYLYRETADFLGEQPYGQIIKLDSLCKLSLTFPDLKAEQLESTDFQIQQQSQSAAQLHRTYLESHDPEIEENVQTRVKSGFFKRGIDPFQRVTTTDGIGNRGDDVSATSEENQLYNERSLSALTNQHLTIPSL